MLCLHSGCKCIMAFILSQLFHLLLIYQEDRKHEEKNLSHKVNTRAPSTEKDGGGGRKRQPGNQGRNLQGNKGELKTPWGEPEHRHVWLPNISGLKKHWSLSPQNTHLAT